jgi:hypothetical protein
MLSNLGEKPFSDSSGTCDILQLLLDKLCCKGLLLGQAPRFLKDVLNVINGSAAVTAADLNKRLHRLGWGDEIMDAYTLELVIYLLENQGESLSGKSRLQNVRVQ